MADETPAQPAREVTAPKRTRGDGIPWRLIGFGLLALYGILLVILNSHRTTVNFVFWSARASLVIVLLLALAIGFLAGFLFDTARDRRKRQQAPPS